MESKTEILEKEIQVQKDIATEKEIAKPKAENIIDFSPKVDIKENKKVLEIFDKKIQAKKVEINDEVEETEPTEIKPLIEFEENIEQEDKRVLETKPQRKKSKIFRLKIITACYVLILAITGAWTISNAIAIKNEATALATTQSTYNINHTIYKELIRELGETGLGDEEGYSPVGEIITISPEPLKEQTSYDKSSNFFDNFCNWLSKLFRR